MTFWAPTSPDSGRDGAATYTGSACHFLILYLNKSMQSGKIEAYEIKFRMKISNRTTRKMINSNKNEAINERTNIDMK